VELRTKLVSIVGREFRITGSDGDRYFNEYLHDHKAFHDVPVAVIDKYCPEGGVVVDVGANIGVSACAAVASGASRVISLEPSPLVFRCLEETIRANGLDVVEAIQVAASATAGELKFFEDPAFLAGSRAVGIDSPHEGVIVRSIPLDDLLLPRDLPRIDILKIDVEGHEQQVLEGARGVLAKYQPLCLIELNSYVLIAENEQLPQQFISFLRDTFPFLYVFDRKTGGLNPIGDVKSFLTQHLLTGLIDDLVGCFGELPPPSQRFSDRVSPRISEKRDQMDPVEYGMGIRGASELLGKAIRNRVEREVRSRRK
jgi:FkbM family methyltransferase